jgi:hypothetical protein
MTDLEKIALESLNIQIQKMAKFKNHILEYVQPPTSGMEKLGYDHVCEQFHIAWTECNKIIEIFKK